MTNPSLRHEKKKQEKNIWTQNYDCFIPLKVIFPNFECKIPLRHEKKTSKPKIMTASFHWK